MFISRIALKNWRNFRNVDVKLSDRVFIVGPNASGKSNFLDAFRFLHDLAKEGGGLAKAVSDRGGLTKIRCLAARSSPDIEIDVDISDFGASEPVWRYSLGLKQESRGNRNTLISHENVYHNGNSVLSRPSDQDKEDKIRLTQTHLEQINANFLFRDIADFFGSLQYIHLLPQLVRNPKDFTYTLKPGEDPFGKNFLLHIWNTPKNTRDSRLNKIMHTLRIAVPQFTDLQIIPDDAGGAPHLEAHYTHWRGQDAKQREDQFSDGTLRLIALLWAVMDGKAPLLLEEPELSLHRGIVRRIPTFFHNVLKSKKEKNRQLILSTHSADLLSDESIGPDETLLLEPTNEGTKIIAAADRADIVAMLDSGMRMGEAVMPLTEPLSEQLSFL